MSDAFDRALRRAGYKPKEPTTTELLGKLLGRILTLALFAGIIWWAYDECRALFHGPAIRYWQMLAGLWALLLLKNTLFSRS